MKQEEPEKRAFYYHYKHDPAGPVNNYAYEVLNIAHNTEIEGLNESAMVAYQPLYETAAVYTAGMHWDVRPLAMFMDKNIVYGNKLVDRFTKITDEKIIAELTKIRDEMYK